MLTESLSEDTPSAALSEAEQGSSLWRDAWRRLAKNKLALALTFFGVVTTGLTKDKINVYTVPKEKEKPASFVGLVVASLRNRARNWHRDSGRRLAARECAYSQPSVSGERIVAECHSGRTLRLH